MSAPTVEIGRGLVRAGERTVAMSLRECAVLAELQRRAGQVVPRGELYTAAWGHPMRPDDRSVDVYVHRIRTKLGRALPEWSCIHTHFGLGYRFQPERSPAFHRSATSS